MIDMTRPAAAAGEFLHYALAGRTLRGAAYDQEGTEWWLRLGFDSELVLLVDPCAKQSPSNPVPWFALHRVPARGDALTPAEAPDPPYAPAPRRLQLNPLRRPWSEQEAGKPPLDRSSLAAANLVECVLVERRVHGVVCDEVHEHSASAARYFQLEFDPGWFLTFDFNPRGQRRHQQEWLALFDPVELDAEEEEALR